MSNNTPTFSRLEVRFWDGEDWPERRISLACKERAVMISPRFVDIDEAVIDANYIAQCVNNYGEIYNCLFELVEMCKRQEDFNDDRTGLLLEECRAILLNGDIS